MNYYAIFAGLVCSLAACASNNVNCENPANTAETRQCAEGSLIIAKDYLDKTVATISQKLISFSGKAHSEKFSELQKQWLAFVEAQCAHTRELYGRGSLAGISYISCKERFFRERITELNILYNEVMTVP